MYSKIYFIKFKNHNHISSNCLSTTYLNKEIHYLSHTTKNNILKYYKSKYFTDILRVLNSIPSKNSEIICQKLSNLITNTSLYQI